MARQMTQSSKNVCSMEENNFLDEIYQVAAEMVAWGLRDDQADFRSEDLNRWGATIINAINTIDETADEFGLLYLPIRAAHSFMLVKILEKQGKETDAMKLLESIPYTIEELNDIYLTLIYHTQS